jgi:hypothetical protein
MAFVCGSPLVGNKLGVEGAKVIVHALESNRTLTTLDLRCTLYWRACDFCRLVLIDSPSADNELTAEDGDALFLKALLHNGTLTDLYISG